MRALDSYQYQGIKSYRNITLMTYNYWDNNNRKDFYFSDTSSWNLIPTTAQFLGTYVPATTTILPAIQIGTKIYNAISDSAINPASIYTYNPINTQSRKATKSFYFAASKEGRFKLVNADFVDNQYGSFKVESTIDNATAAIWYYTDNTFTKAYKITVTIPKKDTIYTVNYDIFAGNNIAFGTDIVPAPAPIAGQAYNTANAFLNQIGNPTGTFIYAIGIVGEVVPAGGRVTPIYLENNNSTLTHLGAPLFNETCCPEEVAIELVREYNELKCKGDLVGKSVKSQSMTVKLKIRKSVELLYAMGLSNDIIQKTITRVGTTIDIPLTTVGSNLVGTMSGNINKDNILFLTIDDGSRCLTLHRDFFNNASSTLDSNKFFVSTANDNVIVLPSSLGGVATVKSYGWTKDVARVVDYYTQNNPFKVVLDISRNNITSNQITGDQMVLELGQGTYSAEDEGDTWEFESTAIFTDYNKALHYTI